MGSDEVFMPQDKTVCSRFRAALSSRQTFPEEEVMQWWSPKERTHTHARVNTAVICKLRFGFVKTKTTERRTSVGVSLSLKVNMHIHVPVNTE